MARPISPPTLNLLPLSTEPQRWLHFPPSGNTERNFIPFPDKNSAVVVSGYSDVMCIVSARSLIRQHGERTFPEEPSNKRSFA